MTELQRKTDFKWKRLARPRCCHITHEYVQLWMSKRVAIRKIIQMQVVHCLAFLSESMKQKLREGLICKNLLRYFNRLFVYEI